MIQRLISINDIRQGLCAVFGFIHFLNMGLLTSFANIIVRELQSENINVSQDDVTWIASINLLPMAPVSLISGFLMQIVQKRYILISSVIIEILGWTQNYIFANHSVVAVLIGRFIIGIALGLSAPIVTIYLAEVTHPKIRGLYIAFMYLGLPIGIMAYNIAGVVLHWKTCILICILFGVINLLLILYLQESYVWYLKKNNVVKVKEAYYWYRSNNEASEMEISRYISEHFKEASTKETKLNFWADFKENFKLLRIPLIVSLTLMITMHLSGSKVIAFYSINIMNKVLPSLSVYISTVILDSIRVFATLLGCILVKQCRIRLLTIISGCGSALSHFLFCSFQYYFLLYEMVFSILSLLSIVMYILFSSIGLCAVPWVVCGEIFLLNVKNFGSGLSMCIYYVTFFLIIKFSYLLEVYFGLIGEFIFFGCFTVLGTIILYCFMPETKNRTLAEIEDEIVTGIT